MRRGMAGDGCPTRTVDRPVERGRRGRQGTGRTGGDGLTMATDLAVGGSSPSRPAPPSQQVSDEDAAIAATQELLRAGRRPLRARARLGLPRVIPAGEATAIRV